MKERTYKDDKRVEVEGGGSEDDRGHERDRATAERGIERDKERKRVNTENYKREIKEGVKTDFKIRSLYEKIKKVYKKFDEIKV